MSTEIMNIDAAPLIDNDEVKNVDVEPMALDDDEDLITIKLTTKNDGELKYFNEFTIPVDFVKTSGFLSTAIEGGDTMIELEVDRICGLWFEKNTSIVSCGLLCNHDMDSRVKIACDNIKLLTHIFSLSEKDCKKFLEKIGYVRLFRLMNVCHYLEYKDTLQQLAQYSVDTLFSEDADEMEEILQKLEEPTDDVMDLINSTDDDEGASSTSTSD